MTTPEGGGGGSRIRIKIRIDPGGLPLAMGLGVKGENPVATTTSKGIKGGGTSQSAGDAHGMTTGSRGSRGSMLDTREKGDTMVRVVDRSRG